MADKNYSLEISLKKERTNNRCLKKWLYLKGKDKNIFEYLANQGIDEITIYGYGVLGQFAVEEAKRSHIRVNYLIDRGNVAIKGIVCKNTFSGCENETVLVTVMTDVEVICRNLAEQNCKKMLLLEDVLDNLLVAKQYPELLHYEELENMNALTVANFGTGMAFHDFAYDAISINAFNFALTQQTLQMDYKLMCHYHNKFANGCKIILMLPYCIFCAEKIKGTEEIYNRYYAILSEREVVDVCSGTYQEYREKLRYSPVHMADYKLELEVTLDTNQMEEQSEEAIVNWMEQLDIISFSSGALSLQVKEGIKKNKKWLQKILSFCKEKDFEPIIVIPPMSEVLLDKISMEFRASHFYQPLYEVVGEDVQILDYSTDTKFCNPNLYGWPGFLIQDAAKEFTKDVLFKIGAL